MKIAHQTLLFCLLTLTACSIPNQSINTSPVLGQLKVGFDIDDTVLFSRDNFLRAPHLSDDPDHLDYGWVNSHDSLYSVIITPVAELISFYRSQGHEIFFITARPSTNGEAVARFLSQELGFSVIKDKNLFFSPKRRDPISGHRFTTKHELISSLGLHIYFGDSDSDMIAASIAGVRAVRVVRDHRSTVAYSKNYFGDTIADSSASAPFSMDDYREFLAGGVGLFGETIYPIYSMGADSTSISQP